ncbi:MAG: hypothetical protein QXR19_14365 [Candidatus Jordarchaeaceae archaeon]
MPVFGKSKELQLMEESILPKIETLSKNVFNLISSEQGLKKNAEDLLAQISPISDRIEKVLQNMDGQVKKVLDESKKTLSVFKEISHSYNQELEKVVENTSSLLMLKDVVEGTKKTSEDLKRREEVLKALEKELGRLVEVQSDVDKTYKDLSGLYQTILSEIDKFQSITNDIFEKLNLIRDEAGNYSTILNDINTSIEKLALEKNKLEGEYESIRIQQHEINRQQSNLIEANERYQMTVKAISAMEEEHRRYVESELELLNQERKRVEEERANLIAKEIYLAEYQDKITELIDRQMKICEKLPKELRMEIEKDLNYLQSYKYRRI